MPTLYEASTERGKANLKKLALRLGMLDYDPQPTHWKKQIETEEVEYLMREKPGFGRDE